MGGTKLNVKSRWPLVAGRLQDMLLQGPSPHSPYAIIYLMNTLKKQGTT